MNFEGACRTAGRKGGRATKYQTTSHNAPSPPVTRKALRHPNIKAMGVTTSGVTTTMKVRRAKVLENHRDLVSELYLGKDVD